MAAKKTWRAWGELEERDAVQMCLDGMTCRQIAKHLGRTVDSVCKRLFRLHVQRPRLRRAFWLEVLRKPHRNVLLARELGVSVRAVETAKCRLRKLGYIVPAACGRGPIPHTG